MAARRIACPLLAAWALGALTEQFGDPLAIWRNWADRKRSRARWRSLPDGTTVEQELVELEKRYWQAIRDNDAGAAMRLTDDQCILIGAQGVTCIERQAFAGLMKAAPYTLHEFQLNDVQVRPLRDDVAVVAYKVHE
jgi:hypothetical protein